jgi:hypothetical protein
MTRNKLSTKFKAKPDKEEWNSICPLNEYKLLSGQEAMDYGIVPTGMTEINSVIVGASGSFDGTYMYFANYCRIDHSFIDQDPYFELYESGNSQPSIYGILHHSDYDGRTELLDNDQLIRISASGCSVNIQFTAKPDKPSGTLEELRNQGKIQGFDFAWEQGNLKKYDI